MKGSQGAVLLLLYCLPFFCHAQDDPDGKDGLLHFPSRLFNRIQSKTAKLEDQLTHQTEKYLRRMQRREQRLYKKLYKADSGAAKSLFNGSAEQYAALGQKLASDTGASGLHLSGEYQAYTDSLQGMLKFMKDPRAAGALTQLNSLEAKMQDADQIKEYVRQRKQQIAQYIQQHSNLAGLQGKEYQGLNQDVYYYSQQVRQYKEMLNDPDKLEKQALSLLNKLPAFQAFMKQNSQLAGLFNLPGNYGDPASLSGLQTRDQVAALIQQQVSAGGAGGAAALQANLQSAQSQLDGYKDKLNKLGGGSGDIDMPDFKPNDQKTKTFWRRLEYGTNFQTTRNNYYFPTVSDLGLSVGYKLSERSMVGVGASYKLGWGNGIQHIAFSSQGAGLRSFVDVRLKGSFSMTGGFEYNYTTPFSSYQQLRAWDNWTKSGLIGASKTVSMKSRVFKKTNVQLLWDFLSYQQRPRTQPVIFRIGYNF
ncbi:hypothetical protein Q4E93_21440 [Flavitalea sp. BT771]|uniref:hypothetical protein n=1 Tax=Flavitalea sp. BT771 TaxID=3063329 RepID=UPI0026E3CC99|nr:hypothetical protein [Flavitalea sp. BT771]MDO6433188.1 hypothetical protein [Flavitalea sp. BT771]MDV6221536.1 hypothetical protein [Flavitalea sp. BT771]